MVGGARSGKSRFALTGLPARGRVSVIVTAEAGDADMVARIRRHQAERSPHWTTLEAPRDLVPRLGAALGAADTVVVDCLTLWAGNMLHHGHDEQSVLEASDAAIAVVSGRDLAAVVVSNEVGL
ncbi:MAG: bifunctional adenosylcobinamide kinase/adenosylcobinamide-phosphate guanylyltransferase, partial [Candidatus Rokuibacteriota bacterium]